MPNESVTSTRRQGAGAPRVGADVLAEDICADPAPASSDKEMYVTAFGRGLAVIRAFSAGHPVLTIAEVAKVTGLNRATARRVLHTLMADGYVNHEDGRFSLRPRVLDLGYSALSAMSIEDIFRFQLGEVAERIQESCSIGRLDGTDALIIARSASSERRIMTVSHIVGSRIPAYRSALGRVLLAGLPEAQLEAYLATAKLDRRTPQTITRIKELREEIEKVREEGYSIVDQESEPGIRSAAVAVEVAGRPSMAMSVALQVTRGSVETLKGEYVPVLHRAAAELNHVLSLANWQT